MIAAVVIEGLVIIACLWVIHKQGERGSEDRKDLEMKLIALTQPQAIAAVDVATKDRELYQVHYLTEEEEARLEREEDDETEAS